MSIWDDEVALKDGEKRREHLRAKGKRLAFDCMELKCKGERGFCRLGKKLSKSKDCSVDMRIILNGTTPEACKKCTQFNPDED